jgi:hypothetical protein
MTCLTTLTPLIDVITLRRSRLDGFNYGVPRGAGSAAFIVANLAMGAILAVAAPSVIAAWITAAAVGVAVVSAWSCRPTASSRGGQLGRAERWKGLGGLLRNRTFVLAVITAGLIQGAHAFYYGFSALLWRKQGISAPMIGVLWGVGVAVEVGFMWFAEPWRRKMGPEKLLVLGGGAAVLRWTAYAFAPPLWLLFPLQALHALTFAASFMASLRLIERLAPPQSASAAQAINSALSAGFMLGVGTLASGPLFDAFGPGATWPWRRWAGWAARRREADAAEDASDLVVDFAFEPGDDALGGGDRVHRGGVDHQFGGFWGFVGAVDAGEVLQLSGPGLLVEALDVALPRRRPGGCRRRPRRTRRRRGSRGPGGARRGTAR